MSNFQLTQEFFIIGKKALKKTGNLQSTGSAMNLTENQVGIVSADPYSSTKGSNAFLAGGETAAQVGRIKIVQGTSKSADASQASVWLGNATGAFGESCVIDAESVQTTSANVTPIGSYSAQYFDGFSVPTASKLYSMSFDLQSVRNDRDYAYNDDDNLVHYTIPSGDTPAIDYLINKVLYRANLYSNYFKAIAPDVSTGNKAMLCFAFDISGGATGTAIGALVVGDTVPFMKVGTTTYNYTVTKEFLATVKNLIDNTNLTASSKVVVISNDNTEAAATEADAMIVMGTDQVKSVAHDDIYATKVRVKVELGDNYLDSTSGTKYYTKVEDASSATEDFGSGDIWEIKFRDAAFGTYNHSVAGFSDTLIVSASGIDRTKSYVANVIMGQTTGEDGQKSEYAVYILNERQDNAAAAVKAQGWYKILNNTTIATDTITFDGTALVEGTDWDAGADIYATATALAAAMNGNGTISGKVTATAYEEYVLLEAVTGGTAANAYTIAETGGGSEVSGATMSGGLAAATGATGVTAQNSDPLFIEELNDVLGVWIKSQNQRFDAVGNSTTTTVFA